jgi:hypothetical protein
MAPVFERHERRRAAMSGDIADEADESTVAQSLLVKVPYHFVTALQATLIEALGCPVPLICPVQ